MTQGRLAEQYGISPEAVSRRLANLRKAGLLEMPSEPKRVTHTAAQDSATSLGT